MKRKLLSMSCVACVALLSSTTFAQGRAMLLPLATSARAAVATHDPETAAHLQLFTKAALDYSNDALTIRNPSAVLKRPLQHRLLASLGIGVGLFERLELGVTARMMLQTGEQLTIGNTTIARRRARALAIWRFRQSFVFGDSPLQAIVFWWLCRPICSCRRATNRSSPVTAWRRLSRGWCSAIGLASGCA